MVALNEKNTFWTISYFSVISGGYYDISFFKKCQVPQICAANRKVGTLSPVEVAVVKALRTVSLELRQMLFEMGALAS